MALFANYPFALAPGICVILNLVTGKAKEKKVSPVMYILAVLFLVKYFLI